MSCMHNKKWKDNKWNRYYKIWKNKFLNQKKKMMKKLIKNIIKFVYIQMKKKNKRYNMYMFEIFIKKYKL